ncbi:unnamed protein product [Rhizophagus irregularis]|nr:unnamed protein product [Rhizophagus irregularis]
MANKIFSLMSKVPKTLIKLGIDSRIYYIPSLSFIANFSNLQELKLSLGFKKCIVGFEKLQYVIFSQLQVLKIRNAIPSDGILIKFLENNGKNLKEIYICFESIKIWCGGEFLSEKQALETVVKYSQNINELILLHVFIFQFNLLPEELESFFVNWTNRVPQKSLSLNFLITPNLIYLLIISIFSSFLSKLFSSSYIIIKVTVFDHYYYI